ncbi:tRNA 2-selenouridine(34) synthase MnmH [Pleionea sp. CnH1-48]|uniref:tRNA 2-selenouridine(34) synthase MnmH n=1 Tax=Pleionea sp. CnH1-48 TaxID=2954494 RepID=UPI00209837CF|nr:tRNA 2-selenouridine(34) synthase MnmH [Pleionea sp. CnH1-48]MCO7224626.1 tRNA 2-selenouridine(34) synthase MnmH [Pleionea sp. CnH1-48]
MKWVRREEFANLFIQDIKMMDARAPTEFAQGAFPCSSNLPLMTDEERHKVGKCYKHYGQEAAIKLGHKLVSGTLRKQRIDSWKHYVKQNPAAILYCFRGGLRSQTIWQWLNEEGIDIPVVEGGYKALRQFLLTELERLISKMEFIVVSGLTGVGKTEWLKQQPGCLDLEGLANHRGSSFGGFLTPQPTQIEFENLVAVELLKLEHKGINKVLVEDEGRMVGSRSLPDALIKVMADAQCIVLADDDEPRLERAFYEYVERMIKSFRSRYKEQEAIEHFADYLRQSVYAIRKRLGGVRYQEVTELVEQAIQEQKNSGNLAMHKEWIRIVLFDYYDPMYRYQLNKKKDQILIEAGHDKLSNWVKQLQQN